MKRIKINVDKGKTFKEGIDTNSSAYKVLISIFGGVAGMERETIQERVIQGVEKCKVTGEAKIGRWFGREEKNSRRFAKRF